MFKAILFAFSLVFGSVFGVSEQERSSTYAFPAQHDGLPSKTQSLSSEGGTASSEQPEPLAKDSVAIIFLAGGRGERLTTPQALASENHVCPKPLCTLPSGESFLETLASNGRHISSKIFVSTNIPDKKQISQAQYEATKEIREKIRLKSKSIQIEFQENRGLGSAYAAYGEEIRHAMSQEPSVKYVFIVPGDSPYVTDPSFLQEVLAHHRRQESEWKKMGQKPGLTVVSTDYINEKTGQCVPTITFNMGCMARDSKGRFVGMVEAPFLKETPSPVRFPIGKNSKHEDIYIYPDPEEDENSFITRIQNSSEVCAGVLLYSREAYDALNVDTFFEKKGERDAFSGPIAELVEQGFGMSALNIHKKWILDGVNTRTQLRALNKTVSETLRHRLLQRGVNAFDLEYISLSNGFVIDDIEPGATLRGDIFLSGRIQICKDASLSNVTLQGYQNSDRIMKVGEASIENSYISASDIDHATVQSSEIFSTDIVLPKAIKEKSIVLGLCKRMLPPPESAERIYETWFQTKTKLKEEHLMLLEQIYSVTILPNTSVYVCSDIFNYFEALLQTVNSLSSEATLEARIDYFLRSPVSFFSHRHENGKPRYTTRDLPILIGGEFKKFEFYIGANTVLGGIVGLSGSDTKIESDVHLINTLVVHSTVPAFSSFNGFYIEKNNNPLCLCFKSFASAHALYKILPYFENGRSLRSLAEFFEFIKSLSLPDENLDDVVTLIRRWEAHDFRDYAENILQEDLAGLLRPGYRPGMYSFQEYCRGRDKNLLQVIEENIEGRICQSKPENQPYICALKKAAQFLLEVTDVSEVSEQQIMAEIWKMARTLCQSPESPVYNPYEELEHRIHSDLDRTVTKFAEKLDTIPPSQLISMLAIANNLEMSFDDNYDQKIFGTLSKLHDLVHVEMSIDGRDLFEKKVFNTPQKLAIFVDNMGEIEFDLLYVLAQARQYRKCDVADKSDWKIAIVPRAKPIHIDTFYSAVMEIICTDPRFSELKSLMRERRVLVFKRGPQMQGINVASLSREILEYLNLLKEEKGTIVSVGMGNCETIEGLAIDHFSIFTVKSARMEVLSGAPRGTFAVAYIPERYKPRVHPSVGRETLAGITLWERIKQYLLDQNVPVVSKDELIAPGAMWLYILPHLVLVEKRGELCCPFFVERGACTLYMPWKWMVDLLNRGGKSISTHCLSKKITSLDKSNDPNFFSSLINSFLTQEELTELVSESECFEIQEAVSKLDGFKQDKIKKIIEAAGKSSFLELQGMSRGECVALFASLGVDERWKMAYIRRRFTQKHWKPDERDLEELRMINFECWRQFMDVWEKRDSIIQREGEKAVRDRFDNSIMFQNTVAITEKMHRNTNHTARPILNILLKNTGFANFLHKNTVLFIDDAIAMARTAITCELLLRSFYDEAVWGFSSVVSDDGYSTIGDVFSSPGPERLPENRPDLVPLFGSEVQFLPKTRIPIYTTHCSSTIEKGLRKASEEQPWDENKIREALVRYTVELKKFVLQNIEEIIAAFQRERISSEEIDLRMEKERHLDAWKYIDVNIDLFVSIIKMNLRGAKKDGVMFTYVNDYLAPHPWLGEEMNKFNIAIRAMTEVVKRIEKENPTLYKHLQEQDAHIRIYEELQILEKWNLDKKAFMDSQKRGIDLIRTDSRLRDLVHAYFEVGVALRSDFGPVVEPMN